MKKLFIFFLLIVCADLAAQTTTFIRNPTADEQVTGTWTGTTGSRFSTVSDYPDATGTSVINSSAAGVVMFAYTGAFTVPANAIGITVKVVYYDQKTASQASAIAGRIKVGASYYAASTHNPAQTYTLRTDTWTTNPAGGSWTATAVNTLLTHFGVTVTDASPTVNVSSVRLEVSYNLPKKGFPISIFGF